MQTKRHIVKTTLAAAVVVALGVGAGAAGAAPGGFDLTFGDNGRVVVDSGLDEAVYDIAVQPDGKIVAAGWAGGDGDALVYRFRPGGGLDPTFGGDGIVRIPAAPEEWAEAVALQRDGKIVVAGSTASGNNAVVYRLRPNGTLDPTFDDDGRVELDSGGSEHAYDVAVQRDGRILVTGYTSIGDDAVVYRLRPNGALDPTFDGDGALGIDSGGTEWANAVAVQPDGNIVLAGRSSVGEDAVVYRVRPNGALDPTFDGDGALGIDSGGSEEAYDVAFQPDGKIVVAGRTSVGGDAAVYRLRANGALDPTFDGDGAVGIDAGGIEAARAVSIQPNGKIVLAGYTAFPFRAVAFRVGRDGSPDASFGVEGVRRLDVAGFQEAYGLALQPDGRIVLAGWAGGGNANAIVVRLAGDRVPTCAGLYATIVGTPAADRMFGTPERDVIAGLGGRDTIRGLAGDDRLCGGRGNDRLYGGAGRDTLVGGPGVDRLFGGPGRDSVTQ